MNYLGLYLFVQVIATFSVENSNIKLRHYIIIGWGKGSRKKIIFNGRAIKALTPPL